jgi:hypothetical protein
VVVHLRLQKNRRVLHEWNSTNEPYILDDDYANRENDNRTNHR